MTSIPHHTSSSVPSKAREDVRSMFASIAHRYDFTNTVLSGGMHLLWKRDFVKRLPVPKEARVLDLCCGTGDLVPLIDAHHRCRVEGGDFCEPMIQRARERFPRFEFRVEDALNLSFDDASLDVVTVSFGVRNFEDLTRGLREIKRVLKPGGIIGVLEFGQPTIPIFATVYEWYGRFVMPVVGRLLTGSRSAYEYLPRTAGKFPSGEAFGAILQESGFRVFQQRRYMWGIAYGYYATTQHAN